MQVSGRYAGGLYRNGRCKKEVHKGDGSEDSEGANNGQTLAFRVASRPGIFLLGDECESRRDRARVEEFVHASRSSCARRGLRACVEEFVHDVVELLVWAEVWVQAF